MLKRKTLAGIIMLLLGCTLIALSQMPTHTQITEPTSTITWEPLVNQVYSSNPLPTNPSVVVNLNSSETFKVDPPVAIPKAFLSQATVYVDITGPLQNKTENFFIYQASGGAGAGWAVQPGWNGTATVWMTGAYNISISSDSNIQFKKLTVETLKQVEGTKTVIETHYPYSKLYYPAIALALAGSILTVFNAVSSRKPKAHRARLPKTRNLSTQKP